MNEANGTPLPDEPNPFAAKIMAIWGHEPKREGVDQMGYVVGAPCATVWGGYDEEKIVTRIAYREVNYGDHGLGFFDVFVKDVDDEKHIVSVAARAVAEIHHT